MPTPAAPPPSSSDTNSPSPPPSPPCLSTISQCRRRLRSKPPSLKAKTSEPESTSSLYGIKMTLYNLEVNIPLKKSTFLRKVNIPGKVHIPQKSQIFYKVNIVTAKSTIAISAKSTLLVISSLLQSQHCYSEVNHRRFSKVNIADYFIFSTKSTLLQQSQRRRFSKVNKTGLGRFFSKVNITGLSHQRSQYHRTSSPAAKSTLIVYVGSYAKSTSQDQRNQTLFSEVNITGSKKSNITIPSI